MPALTVDVPLSLPQGVYERVRQAAQQALDARIAKVAAEGVKVKGFVVCESPTRAILDAVAELHADLIVMGTRGRTGMKHVLVGSVAERTVRFAPCPVMTVKASKPE
jgi:nucleotide-binding universal stress UspA family protein